MVVGISAQPLKEYVREKVLLHSVNDRPPLQEDTLWYAGEVLTKFVETKHLFSASQEGRVPILADIYGEAQNAVSVSEKISRLRTLGDTALFLGAVFPANFQRRGLGKDYFVGMGGGAYSSLATYMPAQEQLFSELSGFFPRLMRLLADVCEKEFFFDSRDTVALYERWAATGSPELRQQLNSLGISPFDASNRSN